MLGVPHDPGHVNTYQVPDVPPDFEVRHGTPLGHDLMGKVKPDDIKHSKRLVVVSEHNERMHFVLGWVPIERALEVAIELDPGNRGYPALWVPSKFLETSQPHPDKVTEEEQY